MPTINPRKQSDASPPRALPIQSPPSAALSAAYAAIGELLALVDQGVLQPPVANMTANSHAHVGETIANARAVLARSRAGNGGGTGSPHRVSTPVPAPIPTVGPCSFWPPMRPPGFTVAFATP
jgi:hypothetical protein